MSDDGIAVTTESGPWANVPAWALRMGLNGGELATYVALRSFADRQHREAYPKIATIAERAGVSRATAERAIRRLEALGMLRRIPQHRDDGGQRASRYHLRDTDPRPRGEGPPPRTDEVPPPDGVEVPRTDHAEQTMRTTTPPSGGGEQPALIPEPEAPEPSGRPAAPKTKAPADLVATAVYDAAQGMANYQAVRGVALKALRLEGVTVDRCTDVMVSLYRAGRPLTLQVVGQALQRPAPDRAAYPDTDGHERSIYDRMHGGGENVWN